MKNSKNGGSPMIPQSKQMMIALEIEGTATLIQNCFDQKSIEQMLRKHMGLPQEKAKKIPADCVNRAVIRNESNAICIPPTAIKKAMLTAASQVKGLKKTTLRNSLFVEGGSIPITYSKMEPRMDMTRTSGMGRTPDVRFRPEFQDWKARLILLFSDQLPVETVIDLLNRAGNVGVGEWRPEKDGSHGTFIVVRAISDGKEIAEVRKICRPPIKKLTIPEWAMNAELTDEILSKIARGDEQEED